MNVQLTLQHINEALPYGRPQSAAWLEFRSVLSECGSSSACHMYDRRRALHARKRRADKCVGRLQKVVGAMNAASVSKLMHVELR